MIWISGIQPEDLRAEHLLLKDLVLLDRRRGI